MELNAQIASLEDDVKLLKSEIKTILKEIRSVILAGDNPFAPDSAGAVFRPVERPPGPSALEDEPQGEEDEPASEAEAPSEEPTPAEPSPSPIEAVPTTAEQAPPEPAPAQQGAAGEPWVADTGRASGPTAPGGEYPPRWSLMTIASLAAWAEEATEALGTQRLHIILDLAEFAGVLSAEVKDALFRLAEIGQGEGAEGQGAASINDSLVVLRQLDAILQGEDPDEVSTRRRARRYGRIR